MGRDLACIYSQSVEVLHPAKQMLRILGADVASVAGKTGDRGAGGCDNRRGMEAGLWPVRTGPPRRGLLGISAKGILFSNGSADGLMPVYLGVFSMR